MGITLNCFSPTYNIVLQLFLYPHRYLRPFTTTITIIIVIVITIPATVIGVPVSFGRTTRTINTISGIYQVYPAKLHSTHPHPEVWIRLELLNLYAVEIYLAIPTG